MVIFPNLKAKPFTAFLAKYIARRKFGKMGTGKLIMGFSTKMQISIAK